MELRLLCILMELFTLTKGHAVIRTSGEQVLLLCDAMSPQTRWFWFPLNPRCSNISGESVEIIQNHTTHEVTPLRFNKRLKYHSARQLLLMNLVMSDAGTYICRLHNGSETRTLLEVTPGCRNNLLVSSKWRASSSVQLSCHHCYSLDVEDSFRWMLNSKRLGNHRWAKKSNFGSTITIYPIRQAAWGRWECHSLANPLWVSEICLSPLKEEKDTCESTHEDFPSAKPTSSAAAPWSHHPFTKTTEATPRGHTLNGTAVWIWAVLVLVLTLVPAAFGGAVCLWKRKQTDKKKARGEELMKERTPHQKKHRENREWTDHTFLTNATRKEENIRKRESLDEGPASLHYAQLQHPRRKSTTVRTADRSTVYAVIV